MRIVLNKPRENENHYRENENHYRENENHYQIVQKYQKMRVFDQKRSLPRSSKSLMYFCITATQQVPYRFVISLYRNPVSPFTVF